MNEKHQKNLEYELSLTVFAQIERTIYDHENELHEEHY